MSLICPSHLLRVFQSQRALLPGHGAAGLQHPADDLQERQARTPGLVRSEIRPGHNFVRNQFIVQSIKSNVSIFVSDL